MDELTRWLERLGLSKYAQVFQDEEIDLEILSAINEQDLISLGLPLGPRRKILKALRENDLGSSSSDDDHVASSAELAAPKEAADEWRDPKAFERRLVKERKQVTVLFADIVKSTELIDALDPEDARERLRPVLEAMTKAVHRYDGTVNKLQGDGIIALFGAPIAQEHHAERACRAALLMQRSLSGSATDRIQIRVGIHSGEVLVDAIPNDLSVDYEAIGSAVHMASRLEAFADPGCIVISAGTRSSAGRSIDVEEIGQRPLKGFAEPVAVFKLIDVTDYNGRRNEAQSRAISELVGRASELEAIAAAAERAKAGSGQALLLLGDAGIGKSRLLQVATNHLAQAGWNILDSHATPYDQRTTYYAIGRLINSILLLDSAENADTFDDCVAKAAQDLGFSPDDFLPALRYLLTLPPRAADWSRLDPPQQRRLAITALRKLLLRLSEEGPLALRFEDLHWFDPGSMAVP